LGGPVDGQTPRRPAHRAGARRPDGRNGPRRAAGHRSPLPNGNIGAEYSAFLTATGGEGGPLEFRVVEGKLPSGLKLQRSFGVQSALIFGTPTREGSFTFTVRVADQAGNTDTETFSITIDPPLPLLVNNPSPTLRAGTIGEPYAASSSRSAGSSPTAGRSWPGRCPTVSASRAT
jgi:hypothetical protein